MTQLAKSTYTEDPIFQEQTLLATLWTKNVDQFCRHFYDYVQQHPQGSIPRYFQEAAYLYSQMEGRKDLEGYPYDAGIKESFERFATTMSEYDQMEVEVAREALYPLFGDTYYFDYYTMSNLPEY